MITHTGGMLAAEVARRYFLQRMSKLDIAEELGLSRFKVARLLDSAIDEGIVRFVITDPLPLNPELAALVRARFELRRVVVVDTPTDDRSPQQLRKLVGAATADLLSKTITESDVLGIGWARTLSAMATELPRIARCPVVQIGGMSGSVAENSLELVRRVSEVGGGPAYPMFVPLIVEDARTAEGLRKQPAVANTMKHFDSITVATVAVGSWRTRESQVHDALPDETRAALTRSGTVAEVLGTLIRKDGSVVPDIRDRVIAMSHTELKSVPELILVASGERKNEAVKATLAAGLGTTLVIDRNLARALLYGP